MEMLSFPYCVNGKALLLSVRIVEGLIEVKPIAAALGLKRAAYARKIGASADLATLDAWLRSLPSVGLNTHFQDHLCATIREKSTSLRVLETVKHAAAREERSKVILIGQELESKDHFRKDASLGAAKLAPDVIDTVARSGAVDLFVRPPPSFWDGEPSNIQRMTIGLDVYRPHLLQDLRRGHPEVLAGPQMVERYPDSPLVKRRVIPARLSVENGTLVTIPEHVQRFSWEP
jgi:hypothetical protein